MTAPRADKSFGHWFAGFVDGEGYFHLEDGLYRGKSVRRARFGICLRADDSAVMHDVQRFVGCGGVRTYPGYGRSNPTVKFSVGDSDALRSKVIPLFNQFPLRAKKKRDFQLWADAVALVQSSKVAGVPWRAEDVSEFSRLSSRVAEVRQYQEPDDSVASIGSREEFGNWLAGFTDGEACFDLQTFVQDGCWCATAGYRLKVRYDELPVLRAIQQFMGCGSIRRIAANGRDNPRANFLVTGADNLRESVIPVFDQFPLRAKKRKDYAAWKAGVLMISEIKSRPRIYRGKGGGNGYHCKWTDTERGEFNRLCAAIKGFRKFNEEGVA